MSFAIIRVPYDSGQRERRMGLGPERLMALGAAGRLTGGSRESVVPARIESDLAFPQENAVSFELARKLAGEIERARRQGAFPVVLAGNCLSAVGSVAALSDVPRLGVIWMDSHGDLNTPETTPSGFLDGMALASVTGSCWTGITAGIPGFAAVPDSRVLHLGARDLDPAEQAIFDSGQIAQVSGAAWRQSGRAALDATLDAFSRHADAIYLHIDMDVHDAAICRANPYAVPGGPTPDQVREAVQVIFAKAPVIAVGLTAYGPESDLDGHAATAALDLLATVGRARRARYGSMKD